jgi:hypothetical protein
MTGQLRVVGAGLGRTGTHTLKVVLERLLGGPCHHMVEVFQHPEQWPKWQQAVDGEPLSVWGDVFDGYVAAVDWPSCRWYAELAEANPDAIVLLSVRESADAWYRSASNTIFAGIGDAVQAGDPWLTAFVDGLGERFSNDFGNRDAMVAAYDRHNAAVRAEVPAERLLEWTPGDGWAPICERLGLAVPDEPFPVTNTTEDFRAMVGLPPLEG